MIRIRNRKGKYIDFSPDNETAVIEIQDAEGSVGMVFIIKSKNHVKQILPSDAEAAGYEKAFGVKFCKDIVTL